MARFWEQGNEPSTLIKGGEFLGQFSEYKFSLVTLHHGLC